MTDFTPAEIEAARREPRVGDVWEQQPLAHIIYQRTIVVLDLPSRIRWRSSRGGSYWGAPEVFQHWTRNATLVRRGDA